MLQPIELNLDGFRRNLLRQGTPDRVYHYEHGFSEEIMSALQAYFDIKTPYPDGSKERQWADEAMLFKRIGLELFRVYPTNGDIKPCSINGTTWAEEHNGPISSWEDFEKFPWPELSSVDFSQLEWYEKNLPDNMGVFVKTCIWEVVHLLFGFERFCFLLFEDNTLVQAVTDRVGRFYTDLARTLCDFKCLFAIYGTDDFGFKTSLLIRPELIRERFLPWHKKWSQMAHNKGKYYFLHSCGQIDEIMEDIIEDVAIDAKHSFEEVITPVDQAKKLWGDRITILGGLDIDFVARESEQAVRAYARRIMNSCVPGGGYCLGLGNWVTSYTPVDNFLAIFDEARRWP